MSQGGEKRHLPKPGEATGSSREKRKQNSPKVAVERWGRGWGTARGAERSRH